jgi:hypothetical protein
VSADSDSNKLKEFLNARIDKRKKQIHPAHNPRFYHHLQLEIDCIEWWGLRKIEVNKNPNESPEKVIRTMIKDWKKRKYKAMERSDRIKIESLQRVLFVIFAIKNGNTVII